MIDELLDEVGLEKVSPSIIMVVGVGGAGGNAANHMYDLGIKDVSFMVCNTDKQALNTSPIPLKVQLGEGLGAGNDPNKGRTAAIDSLDEIISIFRREGTKMVFVTAGMGGGTGTGAAPIIAKAAKEMGVLTVGIVTMPYKTEGPSRMKHALEGIAELNKGIDALLVINNENIQDIYGQLPITEAFGKANDILATAAKGIAEIITWGGFVNVDFADVKTVMTNSGIALMGSGRVSGQERAQVAAEMALSSPLLNHRTIAGARNILINITYGSQEITLDEASIIRDYIQNRAGQDADIIWGAGHNAVLGDDIEVTLIATGFGFDDNAMEQGRVKAMGNSNGETGAKVGGSQPDSPFKSRSTNSFSGGVVSQNHVVNTNAITDRYTEIDQIINTPAFKRRKVTFIDDAIVDNKVAKVAMKESQQSENQTTVPENSLFDN